ncbi:MAG: PDZ domain-containing protein [Verrucomicrobia bacterium]|nr:PDZ domain-containing protein [Verrucomicrobiota bacterium]MBI3868148.1 PDZ domain-containing protein [Verrucomicrobiota bacterium]
MKIRILAGALLLSSVLARAETVKDREGAVRKDRAAMENDARWIYNDIDRGFAQARKSRKPLLVVLRCVPCKACMGIDSAVLVESSLQPLLDKFVCVRVINANALDLSRFQFDYDLSFSTLFFNSDGTLYGRYGSWAHHKEEQRATTDGYRKALERVLALHRDYPLTRSSLASKQPRPTPFKSPLEIPALAGKYQRELDWQGKVVQSCVHCHQIGDALRAARRAERAPMPLDLVYPMPPPETVGLVLGADAISHVNEVTPGSAAQRAGFQAGDDILSLDGAPLVSIADMAWALHRAPDETTILKALVKRGRREMSLELHLDAGWRMKSDISRRVGTWGMRGMAAGGLVLADVTDEERLRRGIPLEQLALKITMVGQYGSHAAAKKAGFQKDDVIVGLGDFRSRMSEGEMLGRVLLRWFPGDSAPAQVLRGTERIALTLPIQ